MQEGHDPIESEDALGATAVGNAVAEEALRLMSDLVTGVGEGTMVHVTIVVEYPSGEVVDLDEEEGDVLGVIVGHFVSPFFV
jgi:hypothetical protein